MAKISQRQVVAMVLAHRENGVKSGPDWTSPNRPYFAQVNGGEVQSSVEKVYDGGKIFPEVLPAPLEVGDLSVTRHFDPGYGQDDPDGDAWRLDYYRSRVGRARFDVQVFSTDADGNLVGLTRQYENVLLVNITDPEGDSSAGGPATFSLTFAVSTVSTSNPGGLTGINRP